MRLALDDILSWLREDDETRLEALWRLADDVRADAVGPEVHLRGLVEFSNCCSRHCLYCGLRAPSGDVSRYRLNEREIVASALLARELGYGTVVLQSGEDRFLDVHWLAHVVSRIKRETGAAVTLSIGERATGELEALRRAGADRYLLRFETSNPDLYARIHPAPPGGQGRDRLEMLRLLRTLDYEVGSGVMVGIPGQTWTDLARDIERFRELELDMIGVGPYIPHPGTPLGRAPGEHAAPPGDQVPATVDVTCRVLALTRLVRPMANLPATTAVTTLGDTDGQTLALQRGANVVMPNITPRTARREYTIYPNKAGMHDDPLTYRDRLLERIRRIGRVPGTGRGDSRYRRSRRAASSTAS